MNSSATTYYTAGNNMEFEQWYLLSTTFKDGVLKFYLDGSLVIDSGGTWPRNNLKYNHFTIGNQDGLNATIDDFRYYNVAKDEHFVHNLWRM